MEVMSLKRVTFLVDDELYKKSKIKTIQNDQNMTEYLIGLIKKDLGEEEVNAEQRRIGCKRS